MEISSPAFKNLERIPSKYTCDGERFLSPPLTIAAIPANTKSLVLIVDDPDVPTALRADGLFTHWVIFNIPRTISEIPEGAEIGTAGSNTRGEPRYTGPCPPPEYEPKTHRYFFKLFALDTNLNLQKGASKTELETAMKEHVISSAELVGVYSRE